MGTREKLISVLASTYLAMLFGASPAAARPMRVPLTPLDMDGVTKQYWQCMSRMQETGQRIGLKDVQSWFGATSVSNETKLWALNLVRANAPYFTTSATKWVEGRFDNRTIQKKQGSIPEPLLPPNPWGTNRPPEWMTCKAPLFDGRPSGEEPNQQQLGVCYAIATYSALAGGDPGYFTSPAFQNKFQGSTITNLVTAKGYPEVIKNAVRSNKDGSRFTFRLYDAGGEPQVFPRAITVANTLPDDSRISQCSTGRSSWVPLLEKAFADLRGGYPQIHGGYATTVMSMLTGRHPNVISRNNIDFGPGSNKTETEIYEQLRQRLLDGHVAVASFGQGIDGQNIIGNGFFQLLHAYTVRGTFELNGQRYVSLRDPQVLSGTKNVPISFIMQYAGHFATVKP